MITIWKIQLLKESQSPKQRFKLPEGAKFLDIQTQHDFPCIWAVVDDTKALKEYQAEIVGTGHDASAAIGLNYLGTFQMHGGAFIFHVFSDIEKI